MIDAPPSLSDTDFGALDPATIRAIVMAAADVAVVVDGAGVVRDLAFRSTDLRNEIDDVNTWLGRHWRSAVTAECRPKVDALLADAQSLQDVETAGGAPRPIRWRHLNHPAHQGLDVPISYSAVPAETGDTVIVLGRDLRANAALQQRLIEAQQSLERDYAALRRTEARYRTLFATAPDAIAVLDPQVLRPVELNPAARALLGRDARRAMSRPLPDSFDPAGRAALLNALALARDVGHGETVLARLNDRSIRIAVSALREDDGLFLLVRMTPEPDPDASQRDQGDVLPALLATMPDAVAITDPDGDIVAVNPAFRNLTGLAPAQPVAGLPLASWVGRDDVDLGVLIANLRGARSVRLFATHVRSEQGGSVEVEISAGARPRRHEDREAGFVFYIRETGRRPGSERGAGPGAMAGALRGVTRSADKISALIGRVPLKELVRESTDAIERLCIESALEMTGNNRASAAEMLGLSRQSLYVKLRRYGFGDGDGEPDGGFEGGSVS